MSRTLPALLALLLLTPTLRADLPVIPDLPWGPTRADVLVTVERLESVGAPLPARLPARLRELLPEKEPADAAERLGQVQQALDALCLAGVHINPESRVKAARGGWPAVLVLRRPSFVLIKVYNEGGVTHPLGLAGPQLRGPGEKNPDAWLHGAVVNEKPFPAALTGRRLEYRLVRLTPSEAGKREATLTFDVGQGTQDLGYRAEVPILFQVKERP